MLKLAAYLFIALALVGAYWFLIRPLLLARPAFSEFRAVTDGTWQAVRMKFDSIKTKLAAVLVLVASGLVELHDFILPLIPGVDLTPITANLPPAVVPLIMLALASLFYWLRKITANAQAQKIAAIDAGVVTAKEAMSADPMIDMAVSNMAVPAEAEKQ